ncbi:MAG: Spy/CpxP family protein refolding chaperone [Burkholderiales bacterium]|nr:Spy/CpxP family protein refolding chaperone [Burkholderiales bacterium]
MMNKLLMTTLVAAGFAAAAPLAIAQASPPASGQGQHAQHGQRGHHAEHGKKAFRMPGERVEARLAYMKTALKITDAQSPQWDAYAGVMRKQAKEADARIQAHREQRAANSERRRLTAIERLELRQQFMAQASERIGERLAAQKPLYAALSPEQQQIADRLFAGRGGKHGGRGGRHGGHGRA